MTRKFIVILAAISIALAAPATGLVAQVTNNVAGVAGADSGLRLSINTNTASYHVGEPISVRIDLKNISKIPVRVAIGRPSQLFYLLSFVRMEGKNSATNVQLTPVGKEQTNEINYWATRSSMLSPEHSVGDTLNIGDWYVLSPGNYKLACYIDMSTTDKYGAPKLRYVSNEIELVIVP